jgi:ethylbenzene dioxygenase ferredoxin subunit
MMIELITLCKTDDVEEEKPIAVNPDGFPALAVYLHEGDYYVTDNLCTHGMALLTEGYQEDGEIECPFHGGAFDIKTGEATSFPCQIPIKSYPVTVEDGNVCIPVDSKDS